MRKIIGINGLIGAGKDTIADYLVEQHGFKKLKFADRLKDAAAELFNLDRAMLEGNTIESREWRETKLDFWSEEMNIDVTPRYIIQKFGTECMRNGFYDSIWLAIVKKELLENPNQDYVIADVRFPNEGDLIKSFGGEVWRVVKDGNPEWWNYFSRKNRRPDLRSVTSDDFKYADIHISETSMAGYNFSVTFENDETIKELCSNIESRYIQM